MFHQRTDWSADRLAAIPGAWRNRVEGIYTGKLKAAAALTAGRGLCSQGEYDANRWLADTADRMRVLRVPMNLSDSELCIMAKECAAAAVDLASQPGAYFTDAASLRKRMAEYVRTFGIEPPLQTIDTETGEIGGISDRGAIKRMADDLWWRRRLRTVQGRAIEAEAIRLGYVHKKSEIYASNATVSRRMQQKKRNQKALENTVATNQHGDEFTLAELAAKAVSNPTIRRGELMTRIAGFEAVARGLGHVAAFFTVTCPSRMHPKRTAPNGTVLENPKFDGTTPREAQKYLSGMWAKTRAAFARARVAVYGFRIAEPHHDGAPHWHLLLFMAASVKADVFSIFSKYARKENAEELASPQAKAARFLVKVIEWGRGSAAGYIAKYVSKNIDGGGYQVQGDIEGGAHDAYTPSHRVEAWASAWGIRQFQQIGGAPVGVWRELRRLKASDQHGDTLAAARAAADAGAWGDYVAVMGGPNVKRAELPLEIAYTRTGERYNADTGATEPAPLTRYDEEAPKAVYGVRDAMANRSFVTRVYRWEVRRGKKAGFLDERGEAARLSGTDQGRAITCTGEKRNAEEYSAANNVTEFGFDFGRLAGPWTRVNNCTPGSGDDVREVQMASEHGMDGAVLPAAGAGMQAGTGRSAPGRGAAPADFFIDERGTD